MHFKLEKEMKPLVESWLISNHFLVKQEFATSEGICDIVGCHINEVAIRKRLKIGIKKHLSNEIQIMICCILLTQNNKLSINKLCDFLGQKFSVSSDSILKDINKLISKNAVYQDNNNIHLIEGWFPLYAELVAIELKLTNFKEALAQAKRYREYSHFSYVALPDYSINKLSQSNIDDFGNNGVGLISVSTDKIKIIVKPIKNIPSGPIATLEMFRIVELFWKNYLISNSSSIA